MVSTFTKSQNCSAIGLRSYRKWTLLAAILVAASFASPSSFASHRRHRRASEAAQAVEVQPAQATVSVSEWQFWAYKGVCVVALLLAWRIWIEWKQKDQMAEEHAQVVGKILAEKTALNDKVADVLVRLNERGKGLLEAQGIISAKDKECGALQRRIAVILQLDPEIEKRAQAKAQELALAEKKRVHEAENQKLAREKINALLADMKED